MKFVERIDRLSAGLAAASLWAMLGFTALMCGCLLLGVVFRYVLRSSLSWTGEVALFSFTWAVFLGASLGIRERFHVRITALEEMLPPASRSIVGHLLTALIGGFCVLVAVIGWQFAVFSAPLSSPALGYPVWIRNAAVPAMGILGAVHASANLLRGLAGPGRA